MLSPMEQEQKLLQAQGMLQTFQALAQDQSLPREQQALYAHLQPSALDLVTLRQKALEHASRATVRMVADGAA
jgi:hypothetical protein